MTREEIIEFGKQLEIRCDEILALFQEKQQPKQEYDMKKIKIGDKYVIPSGTQLWFINLQQSLITTKKYVIEVTHTISNDDTSFFGDLYEITFEHCGIPGLMKVNHGETSSNLSVVQPLGDTLKPKLIEFKPAVSNIIYNIHQVKSRKVMTKEQIIKTPYTKNYRYNVLTGLVHSICKPYRTNCYIKALIALLYRWLRFGRGYILINKNLNYYEIFVNKIKDK